MPELTIEDIAKKANVSRSTVSRVLNGKANVSDDTRQRILDVINATGFRPHAAARTLASRHSDMIGLILPHNPSTFFTDPYFSHLIKGVAQACNNYAYTLALFLVESENSQATLFPRVSRNGLLDGIIIQSGHHGDQTIIHKLAQTNLPMIVAGRPLHEDNLNYVDIDNVAASKKAVEHLIKLGRKRIGTITGPLGSTAAIDRLEGYRNALINAGMEINQELIITSDFTEAGGFTAFKKMFFANPDALFAANDSMAVGAIHAAREAGLSVPDDLAVVGFDDLPIAYVTDINLTTIHQPVVEFGITAVTALIDIISHGPKRREHIYLDTELVIRDTCGAYGR